MRRGQRVGDAVGRPRGAPDNLVRVFPAVVGRDQRVTRSRTTIEPGVEDQEIPMPEVEPMTKIRPLDELDIGSIVKIDERITGQYRPEIWERRVGYYLRRDPDSSRVAEVDGKVVGFMLGDVRAGEFGLEEPSGWIERFGIDPEYRGRDLGKQLFDAICGHFRQSGAKVVRTLVDGGDSKVAGFLEAVGFAPSALRALERRLDG